jgi:hypothetical protein
MVCFYTCSSSTIQNGFPVGVSFNANSVIVYVSNASGVGYPTTTPPVSFLEELIVP